METVQLLAHDQVYPIMDTCIGTLKNDVLNRRKYAELLCFDTYMTLVMIF